MEILIADSAGFCFGVKRAVDMVQNHLLNTSCDIAILGDLIHNKQVVDDFNSKGLKKIDNLKEVKNKYMVIRAHGEPLKTFEYLNKKGIEIIDTTCPFVKKVYTEGRKYLNKGYKIILIGDKNHPEVIGINGWLDNNSIIINSLSQASEIKNQDKLCVLSQTTNKQDVFESIVSELKANNKNVVVLNTICPATEKRQLAAEKLSKKVDAMIIIGGYHSSNTNKLKEISSKYCENVYHIETKAELPLVELNRYKKIGITAGASTPDWIIEEVIITMNNEEIKETNEMSEEMLDAIDNSFTKINRGDVITGEILFVTDDELMVNINYKSDGIVARDEISIDGNLNPKETYKPGDKIDVYVIKLDDGEGNVVLSVRRVEDSKNWEDLANKFENKELVTAKVLRAVKGGLAVSVNGANGFMPASHVSVRFVHDLNVYKDKELLSEIIDFDKAKRRLILSRKNIEEKELEEKANAVWAELEVGKIVKGTVQRLTNFGAFVDLGGVDGLIHISDLSWNRIRHPKEAVKVGEEVEVEILKLDRDENRISLGYKQTMEKPWDKFMSEVKIGDVVKGEVVNLLDFGAFVRLSQGVDGLLHVSQISEEHIEKPSDILNMGQEVEARVISIDEENEKISLSMREERKREPKPEKRKTKVEKKSASYIEDDNDVTIGDLLED